jgi:SAM-dependent methyltransferase
MTDIQVENRPLEPFVSGQRGKGAGAVGGPSFWRRVWKSPLHDYPVRDRILKQYLRLAPRSSVLELGPGSGFTAFCMSCRMQNVTLVDIASHTIEDLREQLGSLGNVYCIHGDTTQPGFGDDLAGRFDVAYGMDVFEFIPKPAECVKNLVKTLRPGGQLFLTFPNFGPPKCHGVTYFYEREDLDRILRDAGLREWSVFSVRLNSYAQRIFGIFHEWPLSIYRKLRTEPKGVPQTYEATWAFANRGRLRRYRGLLHLYWEFIDLLIALGGPAFVLRSTTDGIISRQLVIVGRK